MRVALVSTGLGRVRRGFEAFTESLFHALRHHAPEVDVILFQGGGQSSDRRVVVPNFHRFDIPARWLDPLHASQWENRSFALAVYPRLRIGGYFAVSLPLDSANLSILKSIQDSSSVCISVRRGNYVSDSEINRVFGYCPLEYYIAAIDLIKERVPNPTFFVFSDDLDWVHKNLNLGSSYIIVDCNKQAPAQPVQDLRLVAAWDHFIISNSTFGWWGAWLSTSPNKIVVAPERWYKKREWTTRDLLPEDWIKLPNGLL